MTEQQMTPDETLRHVLAQAKELEHSYLHVGDIVTIGKAQTRYEIEVAQKGFVVAKSTSSQRRRRLIDPDSFDIRVVDASPETQKLIDAADRERREKTGNDWMNGSLRTLRGEYERANGRVLDYTAKQYIDHEYFVSAVGERAALHEVVTQLDKDLQLPELEGQPIWDAVALIASKRLAYGGGKSSNDYHNALYYDVRTRWTKLLTTAIAVKASVENNPARDII